MIATRRMRRLRAMPKRERLDLRFWRRRVRVKKRVKLLIGVDMMRRLSPDAEAFPRLFSRTLSVAEAMEIWGAPEPQNVFVTADEHGVRGGDGVYFANSMADMGVRTVKG